jgi:hypothetical protein
MGELEDKKVSMIALDVLYKYISHFYFPKLYLQQNN